MKLPKLFVPEKDLENSVERLLKEPVKVQQRYGLIEVIRADTFAEGIAKLKEQGRKPFTFSENVEARIADYEVNGNDAELFKTWLDSITGVAYKAHSTKFKIILRSDKLENIASGFNQSFIPVDYDTEQGIELDSKKGMYGQLWTREEAKNHKFWLAAMNGDKGKLADYVDMWFDKTGRKEGMSVYLRSNTSQDELWALVLGSGDYSSGAGGGNVLDGSARFVSGAQQK
ncbi:MAG: hypothetical protein Q8N77_00710 [Nanoarchaeota archaeon]|nr:hypothetical protein [Nanoarchaeota archaeon]